MTITQVKRELEEIKYYYANQTDFDIAARSIGESDASKTAKRYNEAVTHSAAELYALYVALYVNGSSQFEYATEIDMCTSSVYLKNKKLYEFFVDYFNNR